MELKIRKLISQLCLLMSLLIGVGYYSNNVLADNTVSLNVGQKVFQNNSKINQVNNQKQVQTKAKTNRQKNIIENNNIQTSTKKHKKCSGWVMIGILVLLVIFMYIVFGPIGGLI